MSKNSTEMLIQWLLLILIAGLTIGVVLLAYFPRFVLRPLPSSPGNSGKKRKRVLLLIAHPDDECMFFGPTLLSLTMFSTFELRVLSISTGNADGLGDCRKVEMVSSCSVLKVPAENVEVLDHPALQDGHKQEWNQPLLVEIIKERVESQGIDVVITFDSYGVSGHPNHSALSRAFRTYLLGRNLKSIQEVVQVRPVEGWELVSLNIARKYSGVLEVCFSTLGWLSRKEKSGIHCFVTPNPLTSVAAMKQHKSQWVWFRRLFVVFAAYTYVNTLRRIHCQPGAVSKRKLVF